MFYKGFDIKEDKLFGYSAYDRQDKWMCSKTSIDELKIIINQIINYGSMHISSISSR